VKSIQTIWQPANDSIPFKSIQFYARADGGWLDRKQCCLLLHTPTCWPFSLLLQHYSGILRGHERCQQQPPLTSSCSHATGRQALKGSRCSYHCVDKYVGTYAFGLAKPHHLENIELSGASPTFLGVLLPFTSLQTAILSLVKLTQFIIVFGMPYHC
jgi:hypothetical protein